MTLINPGFELGWTRKTHTGQEFGEIFVPEGWTAFWREGGYAPHDTMEQHPYGRPEMHVIERGAPYDDPPRILEGNQSAKLFTFYRIHDAGYYQRFYVGAGNRITFGYSAHAWSSTDDDAHTSDLAGDAYSNFNFYAGIDASGEELPFDESVVWGEVAHAYDTFQPIPSVTVTAQSDYVTVFIRSIVKYPFKHCDAYIDDIQFSIAGAPEPVECPKPREGWTHRTTVLVREDAPMDVWLAACEWAGHPDRKHSVDKSWDHAFWGPGLERVLIILWGDKLDAFKGILDWGEEYYTKVPWTVIVHQVNGDPDPEPPPPVGGEPVNYVPTGCKVFWHGVGDDGQTNIQKHVMDRGASMATAKGCVDLGWLKLIKEKDPSTRTVGRIIDLDGVNLEWFDCNQDPIGQAQNRMNALYTTIGANPWVDYWEIINEQDFADEAGHWQLCLFFIEAMKIAELWGIKLAIFSHSMGVPEPWEWDFMADSGIFEWCANDGHAISLHEYGLWPRDQISLLTRYRYVYEKHIIGKGLNIPLFITEYGPDAWTFENLSDDDLVAQLIAYDQQLAQDSYVAGAHIFTVGGSSGWRPMRDRWVRLYQRYEDYAVSVKDRQNA